MFRPTSVTIGFDWRQRSSCTPLPTVSGRPVRHRRCWPPSSSTPWSPCSPPPCPPPSAANCVPPTGAPPDPRSTTVPVVDHYGPRTVTSGPSTYDSFTASPLTPTIGAEVTVDL